MMTPQAHENEKKFFDNPSNTKMFDIEDFKDAAQEIQAPANDPVASKGGSGLLARRAKRWQRIQNRR